AGTEMRTLITGGTWFLSLNQGLGGTTAPTQDLAVRQAIAHAIDVELLNERIFEGRAEPVTTVFPESSPLYPGFEGPEYDPELAAQKVEEAKAAGWDGAIDLLTNDDEIQVELGIA